MNAPYLGLRPFRSDESHLFFGREGQTTRLLAKLESHFLAIVGASGCGKSSLIRAGLINGLETGLLKPAGSKWRIADMRPGDSPMQRLATALLSSRAISAERPSDSVPLMEARLRRGALGLLEVMRESPLPQGTNLLLLVDQFEEIFRFRDKVDAIEADGFVALLLATAKAASDAERPLPIYIAITMRSDFLGDCALFSGLPEAITENQFLTPRLTRAEIASAIVGPARVGGGDVDPALVNTLLNDCGSDFDQLPLLQHALMRMWLHAPKIGDAAPLLTMSSYQALGGLQKALSAHADEVMSELSNADQRTAEVMFRRLTERGLNKRDVRVPARASDIAAVAAVPVADVLRVVDILRAPGRSFLNPPSEVSLSQDSLIDIGHECLIRQWATLAKWVDAETRSATLYRRLRDWSLRRKMEGAALWTQPDLGRALQWKQEEHPTAAWASRYGQGAGDFETALAFLSLSRVRQWFGRAAGAAVGLGLLIALLWVALAWQRTAVGDAVTAETLRQNEKLAQLVSELKNERDNVETARATAQANFDSAARTIDQLKSAKHIDVAQIRAAAESGLAAAQRVGPSQDSSERLPTVFIQIRTEGQLNCAKQLSVNLEARGFNTPDAQTLAFGPSKSELRYFLANDALGARDAFEIVKALLPEVELKLVRGYEKSPKVRPALYELWVAPDANCIIPHGDATDE